MPIFNLIIAAVALALLGGCVVAGPASDSLVDNSLITGSIKPTALVEVDHVLLNDGETDRISDQRTVRNAVSAADLQSRDTRFAWANPQTGANGVITNLREEREGRLICRTFKTSRQRFDGIALYDGEACVDGDGDWQLIRFNENG